ncbi:type II toxin-antitoxin system VapC family toxin [candidate division KSB1 bacterium]|nr:type II toxin-antitoxin system VapC family toxin [candidate division KSB1 bacterium]
MKPKLYLETTIPSYLVATPSRDLIVAAHQQITNEWWLNQKDKFDIYISQFVFDEVSSGDPRLAKKRIKIISKFPKLEISDDVKLLAASFIDSKVIPIKAVIDAAHIAVAAVHNMNFLMTWNCAHIANAIMAQSIQNICIKNGYNCPVICTPEELIGE